MGYCPLVSSSMANPRTEWRFLARKITELNGPFSSTPCLMTPEDRFTDGNRWKFGHSIPVIFLGEITFFSTKVCNVLNSSYRDHISTVLKLGNWAVSKGH